MAISKHLSFTFLLLSLALCACDAPPTLSFQVTASQDCNFMCDRLDQINIYLLKSVGQGRWCLLDSAVSVPKGEWTFDDVPLEDSVDFRVVVLGDCSIGSGSGSTGGSASWCCRDEYTRPAGASAGTIPLSLDFSTTCSGPTSAGCP
jgi:hypothetical protein